MKHAFDSEWPRRAHSRDGFFVKFEFPGQTCRCTRAWVGLCRHGREVGARAGAEARSSLGWAHAWQSAGRQGGWCVFLGPGSELQGTG